jgi:Ca2+-dependent lipid-binding protein
MSSSHPYSGSSPVPRISGFLKETGQQIPEASQIQQSIPKGDAGKSGKPKKADAHPSAAGQAKALKHGEGAKGGNPRTVHDPTTGREVEIEDVSRDFAKEAGRDEIVVPNQNLPNSAVEEGGKAQEFAQPTQSREEYAEKQDETAPPAPVKPHTTTDVPIRGEKTNAGGLFFLCFAGSSITADRLVDIAVPDTDAESE